MQAKARRAMAWAATVIALGGLTLASRAGAATLTEFPIPSDPGFPGAYPNGITTGPDGALWFGEEGVTGLGLTLRIGRITASGNMTQFPLPPVSSAHQLVVGPDRALWFTESSKIGRIATDGTVTQFPLPTSDGAAVGIVAGRDGALWFTESRCSLSELPELFCEDGKIGRITTAGAVTEFPLPSTATQGDGSAPWGIAAGPDGALWFTEQAANRVGRITTKGKITEFRLPVVPGGSFPNGIVAGPDGALWVAQEGKVGRITTKGKVTEFRLPGGGDATGITVGPDGALWFTEHFANRIGRITTDGAVTAFPLPATASGPGGSAGPGGSFGAGGIAAGADGALWFSEFWGNRIGRIVSPAPRVSLKVAPRAGCTSSAVRARVKVTGGAKLARVDLALNGRRLVRTKQRSFRVIAPVRALRSGTYTLEAVAVDKAGLRSVASRSFRRC